MWIRQHIAASGSAIRQILSAPGNFLFNVIVVAVALSLPIAGLTILENSRPVSAELAIEPELSLFLNTDISRADAVKLEDTIDKVIVGANARAAISFVPRESALTVLEKRSELGDILATLGVNPLPDAYIVSFKQPFELNQHRLSPPQISALAEQFKKLPGVNHVQIDSDWINRLAALLNLAEFILIGLAITLGIVVVTVVFNATRLQVLSHHAEISVIRLLGATNPYIRRPYYYAGAFLGLLAGLIALALVALALQPLNHSIFEFAKLYGSNFQLSPLNLTFSAYVLLSSALLGLLGAVLSVRHQDRG